jgi:hypothetical protein
LPRTQKQFSDLDPFEQLEWYMTYGANLFERSPTGAILEMASMRMFSSYRCHHCDRVNFINGDGKEDWYATGIASEDVRCPVCMGPCKITWEQIGQSRREGKSRFENHVRPGSWCPACKGLGVRPTRKTESTQLTARPIRAEVPSGRYGIEDDRLIAFSLVSRRLGDVSSRTAEVLGQVWGPPGRWCVSNHRSRYWAASILTIAGRELLKQARPGAFDNLGPLGWLTTRQTEHEESSDPRLSARFEQIHLQAELETVECELHWLTICGMYRDDEAVTSRREILNLLTQHQNGADSSGQGTTSAA